MDEEYCHRCGGVGDHTGPCDPNGLYVLKVENRNWIIALAPRGSVVFGISSKAKATEYFKRLVTLDWDRPREAVVSDPVIQAEVQKIRQEVIYG